MISASFIFHPKNYNQDFYQLDAQITKACDDITGFKGIDKWERTTTDGNKHYNVIYYFDDMESLKQLMHHPDHIAAKKQYAEWYKGYHVVISEVKHAYGDNNLTHMTQVS